MTTVADEPQSIRRPTRRRPRAFWIGMALVLVLLILGVLAFLLITPSRPPGNASAVSATFLGYTNDAAGKRVVTFSINNRSPLAIRRQWYYEVQVLTNGIQRRIKSTDSPNVRRPLIKFKREPTVRFRYGHGPVIAPNQSEIWTINAPAAEARWRLWFPYVEYHGPVKEMKKKIRRE